MPQTNGRIPSQKRNDVARRLRHDAPIPERLLWGILRNRQLGGMKFRRQFPIDPYVVDYCCLEARLIVELDGMTHVGAGVQDDRRTAYLESKGFRVIRVTNDEVIQSIEAVAQYILNAAESGGQSTQRPSISSPRAHSQIPSPQPSPQGRGGRNPRSPHGYL